MRYLRRTSNYLEIIALTDPTHMMSMVDLLAIHVETLKIDSGSSLENELNKFIHINPQKVLYSTRNQLNHLTIVYVVL